MGLALAWATSGVFAPPSARVCYSRTPRWSRGFARPREGLTKNSPRDL